MAIIARFEANDSNNAFVAYYCFTIIYIDRERETYKIYRRKVNGNDRKANWNWKNLGKRSKRNGISGWIGGALNYGSRDRGNRNSSTLVSSPFNSTSVS